MKKFLLGLSAILLLAYQAQSQANVALETGSTSCTAHTATPPAPSCSFQSYTMGNGAYIDIAITSGVQYEFYSAANPSGGLSGTNATAVYSNANALKLNVTGTTAGTANTWTADVTTMRLSTNKSSWNCGSSTFFYRIKPATTPSVTTGNINICGLSTSSLGGNTPTVGTGTWTTVSGPGTVTFSPNANTPGATATVSSYGTYVFRWTIDNGGCPANNFANTGNYTFYQTPTTATAGPDQALCNTTNFTMAANNPSVGTGAWSWVGTAGTTLPTGNAGTAVIQAAQTTRTLRWTVSNGSCPASTDDVVLTNDAVPTTAVAGPDQALCNTTNFTMAANNPSVGTGAWSWVGTSGTTLPTGNAGTAVIQAAQTTRTLRWTVSNGSCPASTDDVVLTNDAVPTTAVAGPDQALCNTTNFTMAANNPSVGTGAWSWVGTAGTTLPSGNAGTAVIQAAQTTRTLRWTVSNGSCTASTDDVILTNDANPSTANAGPDQVLCNTTNFTMAANNPTVGTGSWNWVGTAGTTLPTGYNGTAVIQAAPTSRTLRWTIANGSCTASTDDVILTSDALPVLTVTPSAMCDNPGNTISVSSTIAVNWSTTGGVGGTFTPTSGTSSTFDPNDVTGSTQFSSLTIIGTNGSCAPTASLQVDNQNTITTTLNTRYCDNNIPLNVNGDIPGVVWSVTTLPGGNVNSQASITSPGQNATLTFPDIKDPLNSQNITITATNGACSTNASTIVDNSPGITSNGNVMCEGDAKTLTSTVPSGVIWSVQPVCVGCITGGNIFSVPAGTIAPSSSSSYTIKITNGACQESYNQNVFRAPILTIPTAVCDATSSINLSSDVVADWSVTTSGGSLTAPTAGVSVVAFNPSNVTPPTQNVTVGIRVINGGCTLNRTIRVDNDNSISSTQTPICETGTALVDGDVDGAVWTASSGSFTSPAQDITLSAVSVGSGTAQADITVTATNGVCAAKTTHVFVDNVPTVTGFTSNPMPVCDNSTLSSSADFSVSWSVPGGITDGAVSPGTGTSTTFTPAAIAGATVNNPSVVVRATNGQCVVNNTVRVDNNPVIVTPTSPTCDNSNPDFNTSDVSESNIVWSTSHGSITNTGTRGVLTYNVPDPTVSQVVTITATNGACAPTTTIQLDNAPATPFAGPDQTYFPDVLCGVKLTTLTGSAPAISGTGTWSQVSGPSGSSTSFTPDTHSPGADIEATAFGTYVYRWEIVNGSCPAAGDELTVIYDPVFTRDAVEDNCTSMSEVTTSTSGNYNYAYFTLTAHGGTGPGTYIFPADDLPFLKQVRVINDSAAMYEMEMTYSNNLTILDDVGCLAGFSPVSPVVHTSPPIDIAHSAWINGSNTALATGVCYNNGIDRWVTFCDSTGGGTNDALIAIQAHDNDLGQVTVNMYRNNDEPVIYNSSWNDFACPGTAVRPMERHFVVTTSHQPNNGQPNGPGLWNGSGPVGVRLFFTNEELKDLIAETYGVGGSSNFGDGCLANDDVTDISKLYVTKYSAPPGQLATENGDYTDNVPSAGPSANVNAIYRLFGDGVTLPGNGPLRKDQLNDAPINTPMNFDGIYGRTTPNDVNGIPQPHHFVEMDVTEFSEFWLHGTSHIVPLPVEMMYLEANVINNTYIQLKWATAIEINNRGFEIERSTDGQNWSQIGWVNGNNNTTAQTTYTFDDMNVAANVVYYYRLKQVDNDGTSEYTDIVSGRIIGDVTFSVKDFIPNPTTEKTTLMITATKDQEISITLYDVVGIKVMESTHQLNRGGNIISFDLAKLASGTYTAIVYSANEVYTKKIVLAR